VDQLAHVDWRDLDPYESRRIDRMPVLRDLIMPALPVPPAEPFRLDLNRPRWSA
jgi:hypothetical protein